MSIFHSEITHRLNMNSYMASLSSLHVKKGAAYVWTPRELSI